MTDENRLRELQMSIQQKIDARFAAEDEGLRNALSAAREQGLPEIQISGKPCSRAALRA